MLFLTHNVEVTLNDELKPNVAEQLRSSANLSAPTAGSSAEFFSYVQTVLTIGHFQLQKGVVIFARLEFSVFFSVIRFGSPQSLSAHTYIEIKITLP